MLDSKLIESIREFLVISVGFGLDPKSPMAVNTGGVKQTAVAVAAAAFQCVWLLSFVSSGSPASQ